MVLGWVLAAPAHGRVWTAIGSGLPTSGQWRQGFDLADFDGDGALDLVHGPPRKGDGSPVIFRGDGRGGFTLWREARFPDLPFDYGAAVAADFDGDRRMDLALGVHLRGLTVLRGDGAGSFSRWDRGLVLEVGGDAFSSRALAVVDWNDDGRPDLAALGEGPSPRGDAQAGSYGLRLYLNQGNGSWRETQAEEPGRIFGYSLAVGDFDGDGQPDVVTSSRSQGRVSTIHTRSAAAVTTGGAGIDRRLLPDTRPDSVHQAVTMLDVDGDGDGDGDGMREVAVSFLARTKTGEWIGGVDLHGKGKSRLEVLSLSEAIEISVVAAGDLDADGRPELVAAGVGGRVWVLTAARGGGWKRISAAAIERAAGGCKASHALLADVDGVPGDELLISFSGEPREKACPSGGSIQVWTRVGGNKPIS